MHDEKYKLVILGNDWDLYKISYTNIITENSIYIKGWIPKSKFKKTIFKLHMSPKINSYLKIPCKSLWNRYYLRGLDRSETLVFLIFTSWLSIDEQTNLISYIKKNYKNSKLIWFTQDIIAKFRMYYSKKALDVEFYKKFFDLIISYDRRESLKYNLEFHNTVFSKVDLDGKTKPSSDILFIGKDKGRLSLLIETYDYLKKKGLNCLFILLNINKEDREIRENILYIDKPLSYTEVLEYVNNTKCLLELLQPNCEGITYRTLEAIAFNKKLLTNNKSIKQNELYDSRYISTFSNIDDIDEEFISCLYEKPFDVNPFVETINPRELIKFIEKKLNIQIDY